MNSRTPPRPLGLALGVLGLAALYWRALASGLLNDDYLFLEDARTRSLVESVADPRGLGNYFRPLARQVWFELFSSVGDGAPWVFHTAQFGLFLAALALLMDLLLVFVPWPAALAGLLAYAVMPFHEVNLRWISCSQDLLALVGALGALALFRRRRHGWALLPALVAALSKESSLPLPLVLAAWALLVDRETPARALRRAAPFLLPVLVWFVGTQWLRGHMGAAAARLHFDPSHMAAGLVHVGQSLLGLEHPSGFVAALLSTPPAPVALALLGALALWLGASPRPDAAGAAAATRAKPHPHAPAPAPSPVRFAIAWLVLFAFATGPVSYIWSGYHATLAAVGAALLVAHAARRIGRLGWLGLTAGLLWWHAGATATRAFAVEEGAWGWTSHFPAWYFERGAQLTAQLRRELRSSVPAPEPGTRFFFAVLPPWAGFQVGNGPAIRDLYRDPTIESYFYSQFSDTTANEHPCVFLFWNGEHFERLYTAADDPYFQVACDLMLLDRHAGAMHALRRAAARQVTRDQLYWYGWAAMWSGDRATAEASWRQLGARDDSAAWAARLREASGALAAGDSLGARRAVAQANLAGIGRPEGHAALGELLAGRSSKYALLETKAAVWLNPQDWIARRDLVAGLLAARLDEPAAREFQALREVRPDWSRDSTIAPLARTLERRGLRVGRVASFTNPASGGHTP